VLVDPPLHERPGAAGRFPTWSGVMNSSHDGRKPYDKPADHADREEHRQADPGDKTDRISAGRHIRLAGPDFTPLKLSEVVQLCRDGLLKQVESAIQLRLNGPRVHAWPSVRMRIARANPRYKFSASPSSDCTCKTTTNASGRVLPPPLF